MDTFYLKLTGKVNIPEAIKIGHNYKVLIDGSVTNEQKEDNEDGTFSYSARFQPITAEIKKDHGEAIKSKDTRSRSTQLRHKLYRIWESNSDSRPSDDAYDDTMKYIIMNLEEIYEEAKQK